MDSLRNVFSVIQSYHHRFLNSFVFLLCYYSECFYFYTLWNNNFMSISMRIWHIFLASKTICGRVCLVVDSICYLISPFLVRLFFLINILLGHQILCLLFMHKLMVFTEVFNSQETFKVFTSFVNFYTGAVASESVGGKHGTDVF